MVPIKRQLYQLCSGYVAERLTAIQIKIQSARDSAANDTKSSAGDKYETAREMLQQEIDMGLAQLGEVQKQKDALAYIGAEQTNNIAAPGALVYTNQGNYYIAISTGRLVIDNITYYAVSNSSPIGVRLAGLKAGDAFVMNGKNFVINSIQ